MNPQNPAFTERERYAAENAATIPALVQLAGAGLLLLGTSLGRRMLYDEGAFVTFLTCAFFLLSNIALYSVIRSLARVALLRAGRWCADVDNVCRLAWLSTRYGVRIPFDQGIWIGKKVTFQAEDATDPSEFQIGSGVTINEGTILAPDTKIRANAWLMRKVEARPFTCIGSNCVVHDGVVLNMSSIQDGATIGEGSWLDCTNVGKRASLGRDVHLTGVHVAAGRAVPNGAHHERQNLLPV